MRPITANPYIKQSRVTGQRSSLITWPAIKPQHAGTASILKTAEPTIVPTPMSPSVMNVATQLMNSSELDEATAMNVAPAMSFFICISERTNKRQWLMEGRFWGEGVPISCVTHFRTANQ